MDPLVTKVGSSLMERGRGAGGGCDLGVVAQEPGFVATLRPRRPIKTLFLMTLRTRREVGARLFLRASAWFSTWAHEAARDAVDPSTRFLMTLRTRRDVGARLFVATLRASAWFSTWAHEAARDAVDRSTWFLMTLRASAWSHRFVSRHSVLDLGS